MNLHRVRTALAVLVSRDPIYADEHIAQAPAWFIRDPLYRHAHTPVRREPPYQTREEIEVAVARLVASSRADLLTQEDEEALIGICDRRGDIEETEE